MTFTIATWNINSVRLRLPLVVRFLSEFRPDVLCLQETRCPDGAFPESSLRKLGYGHIVKRGQGGHHGVAIISRVPLDGASSRDFCRKDDARHIAAMVTPPGWRRRQPLTIHNFYVPAGGDEPDPETNHKFAHKLAFLDEMCSWFGNGADHGDAMVLAGDLNVAPLENDVWSHRKLLRVVSHTPIEVDRMHALRRSRDWIDAGRLHVPESEKVFTWWSYRARDWEAADKGRRLDHIWLSEGLGSGCLSAVVAKPVRGWMRPSDHAPVIARLDLEGC